MTLDRREFLHTAALGGLAAAVGAAPLRAAPSTPPRPSVPAFELDEATIDQLQAGMQRGVYTARSLCERYLARIGAIDRRGPAPGAVIVGKTNLSEWANFRSGQSSSGWSGRGGQCRNPYALDRNPCGSSSGTGTAIAASLAAVGVGTETDGSVVCPSSAAALVGIKPTLGLVSRRGIVPIAHSQDTADPIARTVRDAAILLGVLAGADTEDAITATGPGISDYTRFLDPNGLKGATIGVARTKLMGYHPATDLLVARAIDVMRQQGATIVDPADIPHLGEYDGDELTVLLYEFKTDLNAYLAEFALGAPVKT